MLPNFKNLLEIVIDILTTFRKVIKKKLKRKVVNRIVTWFSFLVIMLAAQTFIVWVMTKLPH